MRTHPSIASVGQVGKKLGEEGCVGCIIARNAVHSGGTLSMESGWCCRKGGKGSQRSAESTSLSMGECKLAGPMTPVWLESWNRTTGCNCGYPTPSSHLKTRYRA